MSKRACRWTFHTDDERDFGSPRPLLPEANPSSRRKGMRNPPRQFVLPKEGDGGLGERTPTRESELSVSRLSSRRAQRILRTGKGRGLSFLRFLFAGIGGSKASRIPPRLRWVLRPSCAFRNETDVSMDREGRGRVRIARGKKGWMQVRCVDLSS